MDTIEQRVYLYDKTIVFFKDVEEPSLKSVNENINQVKLLTRSLDSYYILLDLTSTKPPEIEARVAITHFLKSSSNLKHLAVFTEKNFFLNIVSQTIFSWSGIENFSFHKTKEEALIKLKKLNLIESA